MAVARAVSRALNQIYQLPQRSNNRHAPRPQFLSARMRTDRPMDQDRAHPRAERAFYIIPDAVADHQRLGRLDAQPLQCLGEDTWMRLHEAVIGRRDGNVDQTSQLEVRLERFEA